MYFLESEDLKIGDIISILGLLINSFLAVWIVNTLQNNLNNKRYLKDHLIGEVKDLRTEYRKFFNDLNGGKLRTHQILPWFKLMNIKVQDTMNILNQKYHIDKDSLKAYQVELRELVTILDDFTINYKRNETIKLKDKSLRKLIQFQQINSCKFNNLIVKINDN